MAGKGIAENSRPIAFLAGKLTLETPCPSWGAQLRQMSPELRAEINNFRGCSVVKNIEVRVLKDPGQAKHEMPRIKFPVHDPINGDAEVSMLKMDSKAVRILGRSKAKIAARGEGRLT